MQSRMDKYNTKQNTSKSRTQKNQDLYESVRNSTLTEFNVNSNMSVIDTNADSIDVNKVRKMLDKKYNDYSPKRRSIELPSYDEPIVEEPLVDTKEYDINAILQKAKQGKNVDYNKERLKKVREAQYEILNNLDLELKKVEEAKNSNRKKADEDNLMNLINTITQLELKNKQESKNKEISQSLELLSDLSDDDNTETTDVVTNLEKEELKEEVSKEVKIDENKEVKTDENNDKNNDKLREDHIEETLSKLNIDISNYDDFSDVSKRDTGALVIKILIFLIIIALVIGAVYILNNILDLGLF